MKPRWIAAWLVFTIFCLWLIAPTEEDIKKCVEVTGWSFEKCQLELSK